MDIERDVTAFQEYRQVAAGPVRAVLRVLKGILDRNSQAGFLIFDDRTGTQLDFDFSGSPEDVTSALSTHPFFAGPAKTSSTKSSNPSRITSNTPRPPKGTVGRPKLGVTGREVTLLPRHWSWLETQPNGISAALRRLVEAAIKQSHAGDARRVSRERTAKVMWSLAGNLPDFEEASRALYQNDPDQFQRRIQSWPEDIRGYLLRLATTEVQIEKTVE